LDPLVNSQNTLFNRRVTQDKPIGEGGLLRAVATRLIFFGFLVGNHPGIMYTKGEHCSTLGSTCGLQRVF
jgi:hypothetical protein